MEFESLCSGGITQKGIWSTPVEDTQQQLDKDAIIVEGCGYDVDLVEKPKLKYFEVKNYLSELSNDYERHLVRKNLGISDQYSLTWGNISGNLLNQQDIVDFIDQQIAELKEQIINPEEQAAAVYYGPSTSDLTSSDSDTIITGDYSGNIFILTPSTKTEFYVNGMQGGFELQDDVVYKGNTQFRVYKSLNSNLGVTKINLKYGKDSE